MCPFPLQNCKMDFTQQCELTQDKYQTRGTPPVNFFKTRFYISIMEP